MPKAKTQNDFDLDFEKAYRNAFLSGCETVVDAFAPVAGELLREGDGRVMRTYNSVLRNLKKMRS